MTNLNFTDPASTSSKVDDIVAQMLGAMVRHGMTAAAGSLVSLGVLQSDAQAQFIAVASGVALGAIGVIWSIVAKHIAAKK